MKRSFPLQNSIYGPANHRERSYDQKHIESHQHHSEDQHSFTLIPIFFTIAICPFATLSHV